MVNKKVQEWPPYTAGDRTRRENVELAARLMVNAALTAPVASGAPHIEAHILSDEEEIEKLAIKMEELSLDANPMTENLFKYEAVMARESDAIVFLGSYRALIDPMDAACGLCGGRPNCSYLYSRREGKMGIIDPVEKVKKYEGLVNGPLCTFRLEDLGFAVGSALWVANRLFIDTRPFMTMGMAGQKLGYCPNCALVVGLPLSAWSKNRYVDTNPDYHLVNMGKVIDQVRKIYTLHRQLGPDYRIWDPARRKTQKRRQK
jgi:uncharacterized ferredoxin-like protein